MKTGIKVWYQEGTACKGIGIVQSNAGEGFYWVRDVEKGSMHFCFITEMEEWEQEPAFITSSELLTMPESDAKQWIKENRIN